MAARVGALGIRRVGLRRRVWLITCVVVAGVVVAVSLTAYLFVRSQTENQFDQTLLARARTMSALRLDELTRVPAAAFGADQVALLDAQGVVLAHTPHSPPVGTNVLAVVSRAAQESISTADEGGKQVRVVAEQSSFGTTLVLGSSTTPVQGTLGALAAIFTLIGVAGVGVTGIAAWLTVSTGLRPVGKLTAAAKHVAETEDLTPIPVSGDDELAQLAEAFNSMLAALDRSRTQQRQFVADAGHELRTPLTSLQANLDLLAQVAATPELKLDPVEEASMLASSRAQVRELGTLVTNLIELARDGQPAPGAGQSVSPPTDLALVVALAVERVQRRAPHIVFTVEAEAWYVNGDPTSLERAVINLLDNAAKFSPDDGTVQVRLRQGILTVADHGPGISADDLPHIFDRFYRSIQARSVPGSGLGLAIVAQSIRNHGGTIHVESTEGCGATFIVQLPGTTT